MSTRINFPPGVTWTAHDQSHWLEFAGNPNFPDYLRLVFVAYGRHTANGHAKLKQGELSRYLVRKDGTLPDRRTLWHAIERAMELGYLTQASRTLCLVVPGDHAQGGAGDADEPCLRNHTVRAKDANGKRRFVQKDVNGTGRFDPKDANGKRRSPLTPSLSSYALGVTA